MAQEKLHIDHHTFKKLFDEYKNRIYGYVLSIAKSEAAAEELTQEVFVKIWRGKKLFENVDNVEGYIFTIARHITIRHLRKAATDADFLRELEGYMHTEPHQSNIENKLAVADFDKLLNEALDQLSPQRRKVYELSRKQGLTMDEIASLLNLSRNTIKNHLVEALSQVRNYLRQHGADSFILLLFLILSLTSFDGLFSQDLMSVW